MFQSLKRAQAVASSLLPTHFSQRRSNQSPLAQEPTFSAPPQAKKNPILTLLWPDGLQDNQELPQTGELVIGNVAIRRARVRYYLERIDDAFPALLNGQAIAHTHRLNDGDVLQVDGLQTVFQLVA